MQVSGRGTTLKSSNFSGGAQVETCELQTAGFNGLLTSGNQHHTGVVHGHTSGADEDKKQQQKTIPPAGLRGKLDWLLRAVLGISTHALGE